MGKISTTTPKRAYATSTITSSQATAGRIVATTAGKGRSRASTQAVFSES